MVSAAMPAARLVMRDMANTSMPTLRAATTSGIVLMPNALPPTNTTRHDIRQAKVVQKTLEWCVVCAVWCV
jgi:hypothetical protein